MINCRSYFGLLNRLGLSFYAGVPDSLLKHICAYISDYAAADCHVITANEGAAIGLAAGRYLATGQAGLVYMQNSGLGNAVNPLTSLTDPGVYSIPLLLLIGWRGQPGVKDEPQHLKQGALTLSLLETLGIPYAIHPGNLADADSCLQEAVVRMRQREGPYALVVPKGTFEPYTLEKKQSNTYEMTREQAIGAILESLGERDVVVSTTGMASREVFELRARCGQGHHRDFLTVGSMGHASQIALGISMGRPERNVYCLDGDGAWIMHMGSAAIIGLQRAKGLKHIVLNNGAHDSVGGQPTAGFNIDIPSLALACGYKSAARVNTLAELESALAQWQLSPGPALLEVRVRNGARVDLGRPTISPLDNKKEFMQGLVRERAYCACSVE